MKHFLVLTAAFLLLPLTCQAQDHGQQTPQGIAATSVSLVDTASDITDFAIRASATPEICLRLPEPYLRACDTSDHVSMQTACLRLASACGVQDLYFDLLDQLALPAARHAFGAAATDMQVTYARLKLILALEMLYGTDDGAVAALRNASMQLCHHPSLLEQAAALSRYDIEEPNPLVGLDSLSLLRSWDSLGLRDERSEIVECIHTLVESTSEALGSTVAENDATGALRGVIDRLKALRRR